MADEKKLDEEAMNQVTGGAGRVDPDRGPGWPPAEEALDNDGSVRTLSGALDNDAAGFRAQGEALANDNDGRLLRPR